MLLLRATRLAAPLYRATTAVLVAEIVKVCVCVCLRACVRACVCACVRVHMYVYGVCLCAWVC